MRLCRTLNKINFFEDINSSFIHDFWGAFDFGLFLYECLTYETNMSE